MSRDASVDDLKNSIEISKNCTKAPLASSSPPRKSLTIRKFNTNMKTQETLKSDDWKPTEFRQAEDRKFLLIRVFANKFKNMREHLSLE